MIENDIPNNLGDKEYTSLWKQKNLSSLRNTIWELRDIQIKTPKYKTTDAMLLGNFLENLRITAEAIFVLSLKYFEAEITTLSGTMIEGMARMQYYLENNKSEYYLDYLTINGLLLEYREAEIGLAPRAKQIKHYVDLLEKLGNKYIKSGGNYIEIINFLKSEENSYTDKIKKIEKSYRVYNNKEFPKVDSMVDKLFIEEPIARAVYDKYCHIKHHHLNNNVLYQELNSWRKEFDPFDELNAISVALYILNKLINKYKEMKERGSIEERYQTVDQFKRSTSFPVLPNL
jgi:hypothetical protein